VGTRGLIVIAGLALAVPGASTAEPGTQGRRNGPLLFVGVVVYSTNNDFYAGFSVRSDGTGLRRLTPWEGPLGGNALVASPDGRRLAWVGEDGVVVADSTGLRPRRVARMPASGLSWSPDGARLAIVSFTSAISIVSVDGRDRRRIDTGGIRAWRIAWSPDGNVLAFLGARRGRELDKEVYRINVDGRRLRRLTSTGGDAGAPEWSPDSSRLLYSVSTTEAGAIWVMRSDGTRRRMVARVRVRWPDCCAWAPDGRRIAYALDQSRSIVIATPSGRRVGAISIGRAIRVGRRAPRQLAYVDYLDWQARA
jgi:hypothetical protein